MSILDRSSLEQSPLADLHAIAAELSIDSFRRLRKAELIDLILERQAGAEAPAAEEGEEEAAEIEDEVLEAGQLAEAVEDEIGSRDEGGASSRRRRGRRGGRGRAGARADSSEGDDDAEDGAAASGQPSGRRDRESPRGDEDEIVEGVVEVLPGGSGFVRVNPPEPSDDDVYISAAQVRRCELVSGDRVTGPRRPPRRSERFASLVRVETVNDRPPAELAETARLDDLPAVFPSQPLLRDSSDATLKATATVAPIGRGSRVTIAGAAHTGKTELLRRMAGELAGEEELQLSVVLLGVRPEEASEWQSGELRPASVLALGTSADAQGQALEGVIEQARRVVARGAHAAVLIDTLAHVHAHVARKALGAARATVGGGSLTVIATAAEPVGGETTVITLDRRLAAGGRFPALDLADSWTMHAEQLVGEKEAEKLSKARAKAAGG